MLWYEVLMLGMIFQCYAMIFKYCAMVCVVKDKLELIVCIYDHDV